MYAVRRAWAKFQATRFWQKAKGPLRETAIVVLVPTTIGALGLLWIWANWFVD